MANWLDGTRLTDVEVSPTVLNDRLTQTLSPFHESSLSSPTQARIGVTFDTLGILKLVVRN